MGQQTARCCNHLYVQFCWSLTSITIVGYGKYLVVVIIITLFQEDNIFGMYANLTYGLHYLQYDRAGEVSVHRAV